MNSVNSQLNILFDKWKKRYIEGGLPLNDKGEPLFVCDGVMLKPEIDDDTLDAKWKSSKRRVVILLKDQHQKGGLWPEDIRWWFKDPEKVEMTRFIKNIGRLVYSLSWVSDDWGVWFNEINQERIDEAIFKIPFALVETKKLPGGAEIKDSDLRKFIQEDKDFLKEELDTLDANIIVCCGAPQHDFILNEYFSKDHAWTFASKNVHYDKGSNILVVYSRHPSVICGSDEGLYDGCLYWVREFIKSHPEALTNPDK